MIAGQPPTMSDLELVVPDIGEVVTVRDGRMVMPGRVTTVGLELPETLSFEEWNRIGSVLRG
jgi:hypothetical protein